MKNRRTNEEKGTTPPANLGKLKIDLDDVLSKSSKLLFNLDEHPTIILSLLAKEGPLSINQIAKKRFGGDRDTVRRRITGRETKSNSLIEMGYVIKVSEKEYRGTKKMETKYGLTVKGLLASLVEVPFEENYLVKKYKEFIMKLCKNDQKLTEEAMNVIKYEIAVMLVWHNGNALELSLMKNLEQYLSYWYNAQLVDPTNPVKIKNRQFHQELSKIRHDLAVTKIVFSVLIEKLLGRPFTGLQIPPAAITPIAGYEYAHYLISYVKNWFSYIERLQFEDVTSLEPESFLDEDMTGTIISVESIREHGKRILKGMKIRDFDLTDLNRLSW